MHQWETSVLIFFQSRKIQNHHFHLDQFFFFATKIFSFMLFFGKKVPLENRWVSVVHQQVDQIEKEQKANNDEPTNKTRVDLTA